MGQHFNIENPTHKTNFVEKKPIWSDSQKNCKDCLSFRESVRRVAQFKQIMIICQGMKADLDQSNSKNATMFYMQFIYELRAKKFTAILRKN